MSNPQPSTNPYAGTVTMNLGGTAPRQKAEPPVDTQFETAMAFLQKTYGLDYHEIAVIKSVIDKDITAAQWHLQQVRDR